MNPLTQALISGTIMGAVYVLLAMGMVIVYQTANVTNIAHGEAYSICGIVVSILAGAGLAPLWLIIPFAICVAVVFSLSLERLLLRPRRAWSHNSLILVTLAAAVFVRGLLYALVGTDPVSFPRLVAGPPLRFLGGVLPRQGLLLIIVAFGLALAIPPFLSRTRFGRQLRAAAENPDAAQLMGVNVDFARLFAFGIAGAFGAIAAVLLVPLASVDFHTGLGMTMRGFIAASLGGMSPPLVIVSGLLLGLGEALVSVYFDELAKDPIVFLILIGVAIWRSRHIRFGGGSRA
jgi:branched-chain amino acid transport system permease protein